MPRAHRQFGARVQRRKTTWIGPADQGFIAVANGTGVIISSFTPSTTVPSLAQPTVVRTRGSVSIKPEAASADLEIVGAYGLCVVSSQALAAGVASVPTPWNEPGWDGWFVWRSFSLDFEFETSVGFGRNALHQEVDSKAMRKVQANEAVVLVAESQAGGFEISMPLRMLMKLS